MTKIVNFIKTYPVRIMAVISAIVTLLSFYFGDVPWPLVLAVCAAIIGGGETAAHFVTPMKKLTEVESFDHGLVSTNEVQNYVTTDSFDKVYVWKR